MKNYRMTFKILLITTAVFWAASASAQTDQSATRDSVMKFFAVAHLEEQTQQVQKLISTQVKQSIEAMIDKDPKLSEDDKREIKELTAPEMDKVIAVYPVSEMLQDMAPVYQKHFSEADMQAVIAFFQSAVGQKFVTESGPMMQEAMAVVMPKLNSRMQGQMADMQKRIEARIKAKEAEKK